METGKSQERCDQPIWHVVSFRGLGYGVAMFHVSKTGFQEVSMKRLLSVAIAISMVTAAVAGEVKSGLEKGANPGAFQVKDITGPSKGTSLCYRCQLGGRPTTAVFTRTLNDDLASLIKEVDSIVA